MVRLNFDYTNRASSGPKLGHSIATDLRKKAERKFLKTSPVGNQATDKHKPDTIPEDVAIAITEPVRPATSKIEVKVPGKALTDEGFAPVAEALEDALRLCPELALTEINISGNGLTPSSFVRLAPIVHLARFDLQVVNISNNNIELLTPLHVQQWECFLSSFEHCRSLRTLNLNNNPHLGHRAVEVFTRVYARERPVEPVSPTNASKEEMGNGSSVSPKLVDGTILPYRAGLRSLPYLLMQNVGLGDAGALFVATILKGHYYPPQLIDPADLPTHGKGSLVSAVLGPVQGIDWSENDTTLSRDGRVLLDAATKLRAHILGHDDSIITAANSDDDTDEDTPVLAESKIKSKTASPTKQKRSYMSLPSFSQVADLTKSFFKRPANAPLRQSGTAHDSHVDDEQMRMQEDFDRACKKIERNILVQKGPKHVELWKAALTCLSASRKLFLVSPYVTAVQFSPSESSSRQQSEPATPESAKQPTYASKLALMPVKGPASILALTDVSNKPDKPVLTRKEPDVFKRGKLGSTQEVVLDAAIRCKSPINQWLEWQRKSLADCQANDGGASDGYKDRSLGCQLPIPICTRLLEHMVGRNVMDTLSVHQQRKVMEWGQWRGSLLIEKDWRSKDEGSQLWMLLEAIECLSY